MAALRPRVDRTAPLTVIALLLLGIAAEVVVGDAVASGRTNLLALIAVGGACTLAFAFWRQAVYGVLVIVFVEGYFRNLFNTPNVLLLKDVIILVIYVRVFGDRVLRRAPLLPASPINLPLAVFAAVVLAQMVNPHVTSVGEALVGARTWLYYVPMYYVGCEMITSDAGLRRVAWFILLCAVPIGGLGFYQYLQGSQAYASLGSGFANATFVTGTGASTVFRPNATFAWSSDFALFLGLATLLCTGLLLASRGRTRWLLWVVVAALIAMNIIENQRTLLVLLPPLMLLAVALRRRAGLAVMIALAGLIGLAIVAQVASPGAFGRVDGLLRNQHGVFNVRATTYVDHFRMALSSPIGFGTGATAIGTRYVTGNVPLFVEFSLAKVAGDLSVVGLAVYIWLFAVLLRTTFAAHQRASRGGLAGVASLAAAVFSFQVLVAYTGYDLAVVAVPFWFLSGAVVRFARDETAPAATDASAHDATPAPAGRRPLPVPAFPRGGASP